MKKKVTYSLVFNRKNIVSANNKYVIQIKAYLEYNKRFFSTGIYVSPDQWNDEKKIIIAKHKDYIALNRLIKSQIDALENFEFEFREKNGYFDLKCFDQMTSKKVEYIFEFCLECIENMSASKTYKLGMYRIMEILKQINPKLTFENIDYNLISLFDKFLHKKYDHPNTIGKYHKNFKHLLNILMKNGKIDENPYVSFKIKFIESNRQFLTKDEIERLEQLELSSSDKNLEIVKDMFLFSCFTGLRFSDISNLEKSNINRNGNEVNLKIRQQKTDGIVDLPLHLLVKGKAVGIISKYENNINEGKIFPTYLNKTVNKYLKVIQVLANIDKTLTYHISRHTFGTLLAIYTNDPLIIKQLMGHGDIKTSMGYIHLSNEVIKNKLKDVKW